jgi:predicted ester cyclase
MLKENSLGTLNRYRGIAMTNEEIVRNACQIIWSDGDVSRIGEFYAENFTADYPMTDWGDGLEGIEKLVLGIRSGFPDYSERIDELIVAGDDVIVRLTLQATHNGPLPNLPATGRSVEFNDVTICTVFNGKITRQRGLTDYLSLYSQLGLIELPASA